MRALLAILLAGCSAQGFKIKPLGDVDQEALDAMAHASEILGVPVEISEDSRTHVEFVRVLDPSPPARLLWRRGCLSFVRTDPIGPRVAHELGHVAGLGHASGLNLMAPTVADTSLTESQLDTIDAWLMRCG